MKEKEKKQKGKARKIIEWVGTIIVGIVFLFIAACNLCKVSTKNEYGEGNAFGYNTYVVLTDSMEPVYKTGTSIIIHVEDPQTICDEFDKIKDLGLDMTDERNINLTFVDAYKERVDSGDPRYYDQTKPEKKPMVMTHQLFKYTIDTSKEEGKGRYRFFVHGINVSEHQSKEGQYQVFTEKELLGRVKTSSVVIGGISRFLMSIWGLIICLLIPSLYLVISSIIDVFKATKDEDTDHPVVEGPVKVDNLSNDDYEALKQQMIDEMLNGKGGKK